MRSRRNAGTVLVHPAEVALPEGTALLGCTTFPPDRFRIVLHHPATCAVHEAKGSLPGGMALFGRSPKRGHGNGVVLHHPATVLVLSPSSACASASAASTSSRSAAMCSSAESISPRVQPRKVCRRRVGWHRRAHRDRRPGGQCPRQVVLAQQRVVLVRSLRAVRRRQPRRPYPAEQ